MKKKPASRPVLKDTVVPVRASAAEKKAFATAAELAGLTLAGWIRERLRKEAAKELKAHGKDVPFLD